MNVPIDISGVELTTARMTLRPWKQADLQDFFEYASVDGVGQMAGWLPHKDISETQKLLDSFIEKKRTFALDYQGKVIGSLGVEYYSETESPELDSMRTRALGFVLSKDYWGRGLMPEAVNAVVRWLFEEQELDAILCAHFDWNTQSARVQQKCGFHFLKESVYKTHYGTVEKDILNVLYREEWEHGIR